jgi:acyl-coenzyme A synthetase/AMP-(fatty) acid ligase
VPDSVPDSSRAAELPTLTAAARRGARAARRLIGRPDSAGELTDGELLHQAACVAAVLSGLGVGAGDRVAVHLPLIPESVIATLACGRLDAVRSTLPVALGRHELRDRLRRLDAKVLITADGYGPRAEPRALKSVIDRALAGCPRAPAVLVVHRIGRPVPWTPGRDQWWHEVLGGAGRTLGS